VHTRSVREPLIVGAVGVVALAVVDPPETGIPWCPSAILFGIACPLCGLTRGIARAIRGDFAASVAFHPLAWVVLLVAVTAWVTWLGRRAGWWRARHIRLERAVVGGLAVGLVASWIWRRATGTLPPI
jgi:hypothetical protein